MESWVGKGEWVGALELARVTKESPLTEAHTRDEILDTLNRLHAAQQAHDVDEMLKTYATEGYLNLPELPTYFEGLVERDALRTRTIDMTK